MGSESPELRARSPGSRRYHQHEAARALEKSTQNYHGHYWVSDDVSVAPSAITSGFHPVLPAYSPERFLFIQMEWCSGQTLRKAIESGCLYDKPEIVWNLFRQILAGLAYMHHHGLIHRDLKPCNIFLSTLSTQYRVPSCLEETKQAGPTSESKQSSDRLATQPKVHVKVRLFSCVLQTKIAVTGTVCC